MPPKPYLLTIYLKNSIAAILTSVRTSWKVSIYYINRVLVILIWRALYDGCGGILCAYPPFSSSSIKSWFGGACYIRNWWWSAPVFDLQVSLRWINSEFLWGIDLASYFKNCVNQSADWSLVYQRPDTSFIFEYCVIKRNTYFLWKAVSFVSQFVEISY